MSSSESEEESARLREAVDPSTLQEDMYKKPKEQNKAKDISVGSKLKTFSTLAKPVGGIGSGNVSKEARMSLRRDKQAEDEVSDRSELEVTPHFQKFVASRLDELLLKQVEDVAKVVGNVVEHSVEDLGIKLTRKSRVAVRLEEGEVVVKRPRPSLLAHRERGETREMLASCAVTGEEVLARKEVESWSSFPTFPHRVEPGEQRIKKKKKKVKKKKKDVSIAPEEAASA